MTIVGVTRDAKHENLRDGILPTLYVPLHQSTSADQIYLYLRTAMAPEQTFATIRQTMHQIDPKLAVDAPPHNGRTDRHPHSPTSA